MSTRNGADVPAALDALREVFTVRELAESLHVHVSTVYRWRAGTRRPNPLNFAALRTEVELKLAMFNARHRLTVEALHLQEALDCLRTDEDRDRREALAADIRRTLAEAEQRGPESYEQWRQRVGNPAPASEPRCSAYATVDPFALVGEPEPALPF